MFLKWTFPSLNLDMFTASNGAFSVKSKTESQTVDPDETGLPSNTSLFMNISSVEFH